MTYCQKCPSFLLMYVNIMQVKSELRMRMAVAFQGIYQIIAETISAVCL